MSNWHLVALVFAFVCFCLSGWLGRNDGYRLMVSARLAFLVATYFLV